MAKITRAMASIMLMHKDKAYTETTMTSIVDSLFALPDHCMGIQYRRLG
jgi:hypothetical protein